MYGIIFCSTILTIYIGSVLLETTKQEIGFVGDTIILGCDLHPTVQWVKMDQELIYTIGRNVNKNIPDHWRFQVEHVLGKFNLKIKNITISDEGVYRCDGVLESQARSQNVILVVLDKDSRSANITKTDVYQGFNLDSAMILYGSVIVAVFIASISIAYCFKKIKIWNGQNVQDEPTEVLEDLWVANDRLEEDVELEAVNPTNTNNELSFPSDRTTNTYCDLIESMQRQRNPYESLGNCYNN